jgi:para-nitrobenzyl esterase
MNQKTRAAALLLALLLLLSACGTAAPSAQTTEDDATVTPVTVSTEKGDVMGYVSDGVVQFHGIPYAKPPVGELRFAPPEEPDSWEGVLDCTSYDGMAVQISTSGQMLGDEDCLYLHVWAPENAENLPVYVWIHGGAFVQGSGGNGLFDGTNFAKDGVVVVTLNYRLGALGYLALDTLQDTYGTTGNWGTLDQIMALQWVQDNIAAFGGDPDNVTIGGESAGAFSVSNLIMSPLAEGLFQRAILESGCLLSNVDGAPLMNGGVLEDAVENSRDYAAQFGADDSPEGVELLRSVDAHTLWDMAKWTWNITENQAYTFWPVSDGTVIPLDPYAAMAAGEYNHVQVLMGYNANEGSIFVPTTINEADLERYVYKVFKSRAPEVLAVCDQLGTEPYTVARNICTLSFFWSGMTEMERMLSEHGDTVYAYRFDYVAADGDQSLGAYHTSEINFAFANLYGRADTEENQRMLSQVHNSWVNFITCGDPNTGLDRPSGLTWPVYDAADPQLYIFQNDADTVGGPAYSQWLDFFIAVKFR